MITETMTATVREYRLFTGVYLLPQVFGSVAAAQAFNAQIGKAYAVREACPPSPVCDDDADALAAFEDAEAMAAFEDGFQKNYNAYTKGY